MNNNKLTQKQEAFTRNIFSGMNQSDAYREAGYAVVNQADRTLYANASRLANNVKVVAYLKALNDKVIKKVGMDKEQRLQRLADIASEPIRQPVTAKEVVMSIAEQNRMLGDYAPERHAVLGNFTIKVVYEHRDRIGAGNRGKAPDTA